jgi:hypothetical protein
MNIIFITGLICCFITVITRCLWSKLEDSKEKKILNIISYINAIVSISCGYLLLVI